MARLHFYDFPLEDFMSISQLLLPEFDQEMAKTRKTLERVPEKKGGGRRHKNPGPLGWMAGHIATMNDWTVQTIKTEQLDFAPVNGPRYEQPKTSDRKELLEVFDRLTREARAALAGASDEDLRKPWTLLMGGQVLFSMPRYAVLRSFCFNHTIHHRAQLTMYLRALNVPVPAL